MKKMLHIMLFFFFMILATSLYAQTEIGIAPGESASIERVHTISILPITDVLIHVIGKDSALVGATVDSFRVIQGQLKVKTNYTLTVSNAAPIGQLNIDVILTYSAEGALTQDISEDFVINTDVQPSIVADFSAEPLTGSVPLVVDFSNASNGNILGYVWDFGDGNTSSEQNPQHTYQSPGLFTVSLTVFNFDVQNKKIRENYINAGNVSSVGENKQKTHGIYLAQNYPNPFNPQTAIRYYIPHRDHVEITLYNITGRRIVTLYNNMQNAGEHEIILDAGPLASGVYFYSLKTQNYSATKKLIVNK